MQVFGPVEVNKNKEWNDDNWQIKAHAERLIYKD